MKAVVLRCPPHNQFRFGKKDLNHTMEMMHADTLFSAILTSHHKLYGKSATDQLVKLLSPGPNVRPDVGISSVFHCVEYRPESYLWFLPKPVSFEACSPELIKQQKKIAFVSPDVWSRSARPDDLATYPVLGSKHALSLQELFRLDLLRDQQWRRCLTVEGKEQIQPGGIEVLRSLNEEQLRPLINYEALQQLLGGMSLTREMTYPKVFAHKLDQEAAYFTQTNLQLAALRGHEGQFLQTHLYFLLDSRLDEQDERFARLMAAIHMLAEEGIGGERSTGCGALEDVRVYPFVVPHISAPTHWATLGLSIPENQAAFDAFDYYKFVFRGGGALKTSAGRPNQRRKIRMIQEGALFGHKGQDVPSIFGETEDVSPGQDQSLLRYGQIIALPIRYEPTNTDMESQDQGDSHQPDTHWSWARLFPSAIRRLFRRSLSTE